MSTNFTELKNRINEWSFEDDEKLVTKITSYCEKYQKNLIELQDNFSMISQHIEKLDIDYYKNINYFKNISIKKFVEHIVNPEENRPYDLHPPKKEKQILSKEEQDTNLFNKFKTSLLTSLEGVSSRQITSSGNATELREHSDSISVVDDDNISVANSRYFSSKNHKGVKIPFVIGTPEFAKNDYLGLVNNEEKKNIPEVNYIFIKPSLRKKNTLENVDKLAEDLGFGLNPSNNTGSTNNLSNNNNALNNNQTYNSVPKVPSVPLVPNVPSIPTVPSVPSIPSVPTIPSIPGVPSVPTIPSVPFIPTVPSVPVIPLKTNNNSNLTNTNQSVPVKSTDEIKPPKPVQPSPGNLMEEIRLAGLRRKQTKENQEVSNNQPIPPLGNQQQVPSTIQTQNQSNNIQNNPSKEQTTPTNKQMPSLGQFLKSSLFDDDDPMFTLKKQDIDRGSTKKPSIFDDTILNKKEEKSLPSNVKFDDDEKEKEIAKKKGIDMKGKLSRLFDENNDFDDEKPLEKSSADITSKLNMILGDNKKSETKSIRPEVKLDNDPLSSLDFKLKNKQEVKNENIISGSSLMGNKDEKKLSITKTNHPVNSRIKSLLQEDEEEESFETLKSSKKPTIIDPLSQNDNKVNPITSKKVSITDPLSKPSLHKLEDSQEENAVKKPIEEEKSSSIKQSIDVNQLQNALAGKLNFNPMIMRDFSSSFNPFDNKKSLITTQSEADNGFEGMIVERSSKLITKNKKPKRKAFGGEEKVDSKVSIISTTSENVEKKSVVNLPSNNLLEVILEENEKVVESKEPVVHKSSVSKKKFFFDEE